MRTSRLYVPSKLESGMSLELDADRAHYVRTVLRLRVNYSLRVFNGEGGEFSATLSLVSRQAVVIEVGQWFDCCTESPLWLEIGLGISRGERMDFAVQKAVELGVNRITPLLMKRCLVRLSSERAAQKQSHWQKIAQSASEQSGRVVVPEVAEPQSLNTWVSEREGLKLLLDPDAGQSLSDFQPIAGKVCLVSGPEGGFEQGEQSEMIEAGFIPVTLGARVLRAETAVLASIAVVQALWGDF